MRMFQAVKKLLITTSASCLAGSAIEGGLTGVAKFAFDNLPLGSLPISITESIKLGAVSGALTYTGLGLMGCSLRLKGYLDNNQQLAAFIGCMGLFSVLTAPLLEEGLIGTENAISCKDLIRLNGVAFGVKLGVAFTTACFVKVGGAVYTATENLRNDCRNRFRFNMDTASSKIPLSEVAIDSSPYTPLPSVDIETFHPSRKISR